MPISTKTNESAASRLTLIIFGLIFGSAFYAAYSIIPFFYYYYDLQNQMEAMARLAGEFSDKEIREKLKYHMKKMDIPADISDVIITRDSGVIKISLDYLEVFEITLLDKDYTIYEFPLQASASYKYNKRG